MSAPLPGPAWLFCPANRPDRYAKALAAADMVIIDLEDAVSPANKATAREALANAQLDPARVVVRINAVTSSEHAADMAALRRTAFRTVMLAKAESPDQLGDLPGWDVVVLLETPRGITHAHTIAASPGVVGVMWGAEDLIAALGGRSSRYPDGGYRDVAGHARSVALLAAGAYGRAAIDTVYIAIDDVTGLAREADDAAASGFTHKACIHLSQTQVVRQAFRPTPEEVTWARRVIEATATGGVTSVDGRMIDSPLILQAERVLAALDRDAGLSSAEPRGRHADRKQTEHPPTRPAR
jgi:citrate lyase subunit beta / citryl-CoA lyase